MVIYPSFQVSTTLPDSPESMASKPFWKSRVVEAVRDDRADVQARLEHDGHLVPGLVHFPAVDALDGEHVEDDRVPVDGHFLVGDAEHGDLAAVAHVGQHVAKGLRVAGHFQADVEALLHAQLLLHVGERLLADVDGQRHAHLRASSRR